jgi:hypothetical protein
MMDGRVMHGMMHYMVAAMMDDTPVMHRVMNLRHSKAGHRKK